VPLVHVSHSQLDLLFDQVGEDLRHNSGQKRINWVRIGQALGRNKVKCKTKWETEQCEPQGHFNATEDALILQRAAEWGDKGVGLWLSVGRELKRARTSVRARYLTLVSEVKPRVQWTDEMVRTYIDLFASV